MKVKFIKYEAQATGDQFYALEEDAVVKEIDGDHFIEVTTDINNINSKTVFMVKTDTLTRIGTAERDTNG